MGFTSIGSMLPDHLKKTPLGEQLEATAVLSIFMEKAKELWGDDIDTMMKPLYLKNNTLTIAVTDATLAQELKNNEAEILEFISQKNAQIPIERLRYLL